MSVIQENQEELRYIKRANLDEESKIYQNYFRDIIHNFGIDCHYYKIKIPYPEHFRRTIDTNNIILHAYGVDSDPKYDVSANIIGYMEVDQDIFSLNKYGIVPDANVTFTFDRNEFACKFANKMGQYKEYALSNSFISAEIDQSSERLCCDVFFDSEILSGIGTIELSSYDLDKNYNVQITKYKHSDGGFKMPINGNLYRSFYYNSDINDYLDIFIFSNFKVLSSDLSTRYLVGNLSGSVLFHDIHSIGKYINLIQPNVGDVITIDFPDETSREQYEITECLDKNLGNDGINPLLHKYVWKCKARRYVNSGEDFPEKNEANERHEEIIDTIEQADEDVAKKISIYDTLNNDAVYGGYELEEKDTDKEIINAKDPNECDNTFIDDGSYLTIHAFPNDTKIATDGYDLYFVLNNSKKIEIKKLTNIEDKLPVQHWTRDGLQYLAATDQELFFKNFDGGVSKVCSSAEITNEQREICMNSILDSSYSTGEINKDGDVVYKFKNCRTFLISQNNSLYCVFEKGSNRFVKIC